MDVAPGPSSGPAWLRQPWTVHGRTRVCTFRHRLLLAPMEGITDQVFRDHVLRLGGVGGACTEFLRISVSPIPARVIRRHLSPNPDPASAPVGVQFMASAVTHIADSVRAADACGAAWIDLNFGCPAPIVVGNQAGSALLCKPSLMAGMVAAAIGATGLPVSAKIRAGIDSPAPLADNMRALADAGASFITVHGRLRTTPYSKPANWAWITEAVAALRAAGHRIPVVGNGSVEGMQDAAAVGLQTGCDAVMIGRGALADPWLFRQALGEPGPSRTEAVSFALDYAEDIARRLGPGAALAKLKQLTRWYSAAGIIDAEGRQHMLRVETLADLQSAYRLTASPITGR